MVCVCVVLVDLAAKVVSEINKFDHVGLVARSLQSQNVPASSDVTVLTKSSLELDPL